MMGVKKTGRALELDAITKGDNNCFFNAVFAQVQRTDVAGELAGEAPIRSPHDLRLKVARFAKKSKLDVVDKFKRIYYETYPPELWDEFWNRMEQDQEWADAITAQATAWFLHHDIHIVMACGAEKTFFGSWDREGASCAKTTLLLGYLNNIHYQSLLPLGEAVFSTASFQPMAFRDIIKVVVEAHKKKNQTQRGGEGGGGDHLEDQIPPKKAKVEICDFNFTWSSETLCVKPAKVEGWICPFCQSEEKRIIAHIKGKHLKSTEGQDFFGIEKDFRKHARKKSKQNERDRQRKTDEEGFKRQNREAAQATRNRKKMADKEGFNRQNREAVQATRNRKKVADKEGFNRQTREAVQATRSRRKVADKERFMEEQRKAGQVSKNKRLNKDPKKYKKSKKKDNQKQNYKRKTSHEAAVKRFHQETCYGPVFECVSCRTNNFRHNAVEYNEKTQAQIRTKAKEAHIRDYNSKLEQVNMSCVVNF